MQFRRLAASSSLGLLFIGHRARAPSCANPANSPDERPFNLAFYIVIRLMLHILIRFKTHYRYITIPGTVVVVHLLWSLLICCPTSAFAALVHFLGALHSSPGSKNLSEPTETGSLEPLGPSKRLGRKKKTARMHPPEINKLPAGEALFHILDICTYMLYRKPTRVTHTLAGSARTRKNASKHFVAPQISSLSLSD